MKKTLNQLRDEAYKNSVEHGFHDADKEFSISKSGFHALFAQRIALIHSELSEALEADRKERFADLRSFDDSLQPFEDKFKAYIKDPIPDYVRKLDIFMRIISKSYICKFVEEDDYFAISGYTKDGKELAACDKEFIKSFVGDKLIEIEMKDKGLSKAKFIIKLKKE